MRSQAFAEERGHLPASHGSIEALTKRLRALAKGQVRSPAPAASIEPLAELHAGFRTSGSVVLHKFGTDPNYDSWRSGALLPKSRQQFGALISGRVGPTRDVRTEQLDRAVQADLAVERSQTAPSASVVDRSADRIRQVRAEMLANDPASRQPGFAVGTFIVSRSQRNPSPLFGLGLIDAIPAEAIEAMAKRQASESPGIQGRPSQLKDGRIGRLGWKGQTADVRDFVLTACAVELGLEVPGHHQALIPQAPKYQPPGLDLTSDECEALVAYVRSLPRPVERKATSATEARHLATGKAAFSRIGCASCHTAKVGNVEGLYSDLLLHDMGQEMAQQGSYSDSSRDTSDDPPVSEMPPGVAQNGPFEPASKRTNRGATSREWRTPPLWGFRDSGPYLHDGRAQPSSRPSPCTTVKAPTRHGSSSSSHRASGSRSRRFSSRWLPQPPSSSPARGIDAVIKLGVMRPRGDRSSHHALRDARARRVRRTDHRWIGGLIMPRRGFTCFGFGFVTILAVLARAQELTPDRIDAQGQNGEVVALAWTPDGKTVMTASGSPIIACWETSTREVRRRLSDPSGIVRALAVSPDGLTLATGGDGKVVTVWDLASGRERATLAGHAAAITCLAFSPDGKTLASGSRDAAAAIWSIATAKELATLARHTSAVTCLAFSPDAKTLATGSLDWTVKVWDLGSGRARYSFDGHGGAIDAVAFSPDGATLASTSRDGTTRLCDVITGRETAVLQGPREGVGPLAFLA